MRILFAGDLRPNRKVVDCFDRGDYGTVFGEVLQCTNTSDYSIVNLESPIVDGNTTPIKKTGPNIKCKANTIPAIKYAGFDCVSLANNHFYDFGEKGVMDTIAACQKNGMDYMGGGINLQEANKILYKVIDGKKVAFINRCENEWSIAKEGKGGSAPLDTIKTYYDIQTAKLEADFVVLVLHGGIEHYELPTPQMKKTYRFFVDAGADAVVNHHQHCYSGYEVYKGKPIFYGLGNFNFFQLNTDRKWEEGYLVTVQLDDDVVSFEIHPYAQCRNQEPTVSFDVDKDAFQKSIQSLNAIIEDDTLLEQHYQELIVSKQQLFLDYLEPHSSKYLYGLQHRKLLPRLLKENKIKYLLNLTRCESHRDVLIKILENTVQK